MKHVISILLAAIFGLTPLGAMAQSSPLTPGMDLTGTIDQSISSSNAHIGDRFVISNVTSGADGIVSNATIYGHVAAVTTRLRLLTYLAVVPYRNPVEAANDLAEGRVQVYEAALAIVRPQLEAGKIKPLIMTNSVRAPTLPDVPTATEAGHPELAAGCQP